MYAVLCRAFAGWHARRCRDLAAPYANVTAAHSAPESSSDETTSYGFPSSKNGRHIMTVRRDGVAHRERTHGERRPSALAGLAKAYLARDEETRGAIIESIRAWHSTLAEQRERAGGGVSLAGSFCPNTSVFRPETKHISNHPPRCHPNPVAMQQMPPGGQLPHHSTTSPQTPSMRCSSSSA